MEKNQILQLLHDYSVQDPSEGTTYEHQVIRDNDYEAIADILCTPPLDNFDLQEFRDQQNDYFDADGKVYPLAFKSSDMPERMLRIINALTGINTPSQQI